MSAASDCIVPCQKAPRYVQQLVSHWRHKMEATWIAEGQGGRAEFPFARDTHVTMRCEPDKILITLTSPSREQNYQMQGVIERHLNRFAFREAPLEFAWAPQPDV